jgi:hypothetical protein
MIAIAMIAFRPNNPITIHGQLKDEQGVQSLAQRFVKKEK